MAGQFYERGLEVAPYHAHRERPVVGSGGWWGEVACHDLDGVSCHGLTHASGLV
jgi:hypothetical protein